ncbi:hypothetical protein KDZ21_08190 [Lactobacillus crispatus]|uniref:hypothetical protein n=1 Tax=Lactobacillus crispatus TaxID=47770 RepID=UPI001C4E1D9E|nr:hypothetical protein [Lactobacillus crispatus]MBW0438006.1 hypothetical protein [Lactobacillus crispatus]MBW0444557.1 hypothetical protein [Lactobacillus crispatus]MBW0456228.1 hypothetical protein [Lactobacillus crispatus]
MADIKFMNLSENGNPALTDSLLIGNSDSGLKRVTLDTLKNTVAPAINKPLVIVKSTPINFADFSANGFASVTAQSVNNYTFLCWLSISPVNSSVHPKFTSPDKSSSQAWLDDPNADWQALNAEHSSGKDPWFNAYAIYVSDSVMK